LLVLIQTLPPPTLIVPDAFTPNVELAWVRTSLPLPVHVPLLPIFNAFA
jgi:hypothetical protein